MMTKAGITTLARTLAVGLCAAGSLCASHSVGRAQSNYPDHPVRVIVPFGAGGPADIFARYLGQQVQGPLDQPFVVENRPGAGSIIGTDVVAKSPADGYTLLVMSNTHTVNESLIRKKPFVLMKDFVPVVPINYSDLLLVIHPSVPSKTLKEFIQIARRNPGKLNYGSGGIGTTTHLAP